MFTELMKTAVPENTWGSTLMTVKVVRKKLQKVRHNSK